MNPVLDRVENTISRYSMIPAGIRLGVAVSGGADSVFLLHFLARRGGTPLTVIHVDHGLRGEASKEDCAFVAGLASGLGLPFAAHRMGEPSGNLEQYCRRERLGFFRRLREEGVVDRVATGHTASDQAETVLMRLLRGAGTTGLRGVLPVTAEGLIRPLLSVGRDEVRDWLRREGLGWREDASNASAVFLRNRVRAEALPVLRKLDAGVEQALGRTAELAAIDEEYWRAETEKVMQLRGRRQGEAVVLDCRGAAELHAALLGRVARRAIEEALGGLRQVDRGHVERVTALFTAEEGEGATEFPGGKAVRSLDWVRVEKRGGQNIPPAVELTVPGTVIWGRWQLRLEEGLEGLDMDRVRGPLRLRGWRAGDRFSGELVKNFFQRRRIPSWDRAGWPMIEDSDGILWMHGRGAAVRAAADGSTRRILRVGCDTISS